jgi:hypothetical protein
VQAVSRAIELAAKRAKKVRAAIEGRIIGG